MKLRLIALEGKSPSDTVGERHDMVLLFDCSKSNPNGDPDTGNMPRIQPDSLKGLVTDVCLKRKIRNLLSQYHPDGIPRGDAAAKPGYDVFIRENAILQHTLESEAVAKRARSAFEEIVKKDNALKSRSEALMEDAFGLKQKSGLTESEKKEAKTLVRTFAEVKERAFRDALCDLYFDIRWFGAVVSTKGPLKGSFYGQIRGPIQITFAESLDKVLQLDASITRCAKTSEDERGESEEGGNRTMGRKFGIDYGLYRCNIHLSPAFAAKTGFTYYDLDNFLFALTQMFEQDHAAGRHVRMVGLVDFQHATALGNAPAHKLFEQVCVTGIKNNSDGATFKSSGSEFPRDLSDYRATAPGGTDGYSAVEGEKMKNVKARKIIWEFRDVPVKEAS
ncbi:MAG: type I-C CRISPR-associated protein Cas7/Csd2 [Verrucomicrobia bacterium]|nr:type I-C CRISPR-associated protein Cas7/Csd2 [Verrucomicrobiota bacterium]